MENNLFNYLRKIAKDVKIEDAEEKELEQLRKGHNFVFMKLIETYKEYAKQVEEDKNIFALKSSKSIELEEKINLYAEILENLTGMTHERVIGLLTNVWCKIL